MEHLGKQRNALFTDVKEKGWPASSRNVLLFTKFTIKNEKTGWASLTDRDEHTTFRLQSVMFQLHSQDDLECYSLWRQRGHTMKSVSGWELKRLSAPKQVLIRLPNRFGNLLPLQTLCLCFIGGAAIGNFSKLSTIPRRRRTIPRSNPLHTAICQV